MISSSVSTLYIASIASGSNGNCYYIANETDAVLVDAGISCREIETRMGRLGLPLSGLKAVFISHEHTDHISGVSALAKKYALPVYITPQTAGRSRIFLRPELYRRFTPHEPVTIGNLTVMPFPKLHDGCDPHSFTVSGNGVTIGVFTDIGEACKDVVHHFGKCHAVFLESNYDEVMLEQGRYPVHLKRRISGHLGHLSNRQALELFIAHRSAGLSHILLSHLSRDNNHPDLAKRLFDEHAGDTQIIVAGRHKETDVYTIRGNAGAAYMPAAKESGRKAQLSLF